MQRGIIEYIDANEENDTLIALDEAHIVKDTTHMELDPCALISVIAGMVPFSHHNQSPRNTYQCAMGRQAIGMSGYNHHLRMDRHSFRMVHLQRPMISSKSMDLIGFGEVPAGQNAMVAVMSFSGYDLEDALILNKASLDRGFARAEVTTRYDTTLKMQNGAP